MFQWNPERQAVAANARRPFTTGEVRGSNSSDQPRRSTVKETLQRVGRDPMSTKRKGVTWSWP